ncbi:DUF7507 domain-containing protein [Corynebacterium bovis]|uniref:Putative membrane protein n=2 Tax=Corynebacterium bovis TaxID=36808 RepID=A0A8H9YBC1_9CORY|nr:FxLYD domain-containing protein [Corynebacterium bovis]MBB3116167.1 putative membrane protein [Corynebacterium bovis DSM 20582 = CIP 54.80]QQC47088.1 hypothetical protein I6I09_08475 [Corynebacterium bovis]
MKNPVMYAAAGESAPAGTAILRINARAFSDNPWEAPKRATAAQSTDYRYSSGLKFELWTADSDEDDAQEKGAKEKVNADWASCTTNDQGTCDIVIPQSHLNKRYAVKQVNDAQGSFHMDYFNWGDHGNAKNRHNAPYPGYTVRVQSGKVYSFPLTSDIDDDRRSFGAAAQSLDNPPLEAARTCYPRGPRIALVMDTTLSIEDSGNKNNLRNAVYGPDGFVDNLLGTGAEIASFSFAELSPGDDQQNFPEPLNVDTDAEKIKKQIREHNLNNFDDATSWEQGLAAVYEANKQYHYDEVIFITDGDPNHWSRQVEGPNNDGSVRAIEAGIYRANLIKAMGTRIVTIGAGWAANPGQTDSSNQLKAVSGPVSGLDYFATDWGRLAESLRYAGNQITCQTGVNAKKVIVDAAGKPVADQSPAKDWAIDISAENFAGTVDNGRGENPANLPLAALNPNNDTDDSANPLVLKDQERTTGDDNIAHWGISYYARDRKDAHSDVTLAEKTDSKPGFKFVPGKMVNGEPTGSYYKIIDRTTRQPVGDPVMITSPSQKIQNVQRGQTVEAVFANTPEANFSVEKTAKTKRITAGSDGTFTAEFTVTVTNSSKVAGTSPSVNDRPVEDSDFVADTVMVDGHQVEVGDGGTYEVTPGVPLEPGGKKTFTVTLKGRTPPGFLENQRPAECTPENPDGVRNGVEMSGDTDGNANNEACVSVDPPKPGALAIIKKINGDDANNAPGVSVEVGQDMNVTYEVTNTGGMPVYKVTVADKITTEGDKAVENITADDQAKAAKLDPGQTVTFSTKVKAPATGGTLHTDVAKAHGVATDPKNPNAPGQNAPQVESNEDPANATTKPKDGLTIVKKINGNDANDAPGVEVEPGEDMPVTYEVTNTGNRPVFNVNVTDKITTEGDKAVTNITADDRAKAAKLDPGQTVTFSATIKAPATGGTLHTDLAQAHGVPPKPGKPNEPGDPNDPQTPPVNSNEDPANATTKSQDGLTIVKKINNADANEAPGVEVEPGEDMPVTYEVTSTGNRPVFNVNVTDKITTEGDKAVTNITADDRAKAAKLDPGQTVTFSATVKAPATGGTLHTDLAQAHGVPPKPGKPNEPDDPKDPQTPPVNSNEDPANATTNPKDGLTIVKKINGNDANDAPGVEVNPGADMNVTYEVTNTGNRPVFNVTVADKITTEGDKAVTDIKPSDAAKAAKLNPKETVTFTATIKAPATGGTLHTDKATAHGVPPKPGKPNEPDDPKDPQTPPVNSNEDPANATTNPKDGLTIVKKINGNDANDAPGVTVEPGADMNVTYEVTNTGNRPVFNVNVTDKITTEGDKAVTNITADDRAKAAKLNPKETVTFTATIKAPATGGTLHTDKATAHGVPPKPGKPNEPDDPKDPQTPPVNSNEDPANATTKSQDGLTIVKKINGNDANDAPGVSVNPGEDMNVTYEVTNTGNRPVFNVTVTDRVESENNAEVKNIAPAQVDRVNPGETVTFTATIKAPATGGTLHTDKASAHGVPPKPGKPNEPGDPNDPKSPPVNSPEDPANATTKPKDGLKVVKKINGDDANQAPGVSVDSDADMNVTYEVTNTGGRPVFNVNVTDKIITEGDTAVTNITADDRAKAAKLDPGQTVTFSAKVKAPATGGTLHTDLAQAHGLPPSPTNPNEPGDPNDPKSPPVNSPEDPANATTKPKDELKVVKKINGDDANIEPGVAVKPGSDMDVTYEVTNTGNRPLSDVTVTDRIVSENNTEVKGITPEKVDQLKPGETVTFKATIKAPAADGVKHHDVATAHGVPPSPSEPPSPTEPNKPGNPPSSTEPPSPSEPNKPGVPPVNSPDDPGYAHTPPKDSLKIVKKINGDDANTKPGVEVDAGSDMKITYEVTNDGQRPVFNVSVTDKITSENNAEVKDITTATPEKAAKLNPGEKVEFTATIKAPTAGGVLHTDVAKAHGVPPSPDDPEKPAEPPSPDDPNKPAVPPVESNEDPGNATTKPKDGLKVVKKINGDDANAEPGVEVAPGSDMDVTYEVTNTGDRPLSDVSVTDRIVSENNTEVKGITPEKVDQLKPGETVTFKATIKAPAADGVKHHDVATAHGVPPSPSEPPSPTEPNKPGNPPSSTEPPSPSEPGKPGEPPSPSEPNKPGVPPVNSPEDPGYAHTPPKDSLKLVKKINGDDANNAPGVSVEPGSDMKITYEVTNDGQRPVFNVSVTDKITSENNAEVKNITTATPEKAAKLNPGEKVEFTATIKAPEASNKLHTDVAKAYGVPPSPSEPPSPTEPGKPGNPPSSTEPPSPSEPGKPGNPPSSTEPPSPDDPNKPAVPPVESNEDPGNATTKPKDGLKLVKKINGDDANNAPGVSVEPGSDMKVTYEVTNTGDRPVFNVSVTDKITTEGGKVVEGITASDPEKAKQLNPNETVEFTATIKAPEAGNKLHTDVAKAYGVPPSPSVPPSPTEPGKPGNPPSSTEPPSPSEPGKPGNPPSSTEPPSPSEPGKPGNPPSSTEPPSPDDPNKPAVPPVESNEDPGNATTKPKDGLKVVKKINGDDANAEPGVEVAPGSDMDVTYEVTNTGDRPLSDVSVTDRIVSENNTEVKGITPEKVDQLKPGETVTFKATIKAPAADGAQHHDVATAHGVPPSPSEPPSPTEPNKPGNPPSSTEPPSPSEPGKPGTRRVRLSRRVRRSRVSRVIRRVRPSRRVRRSRVSRVIRRVRPSRRVRRSRVSPVSRRARLSRTSLVSRRARKSRTSLVFRR